MKTIKLSKGYEAMVDDEDYDLIKDKYWKYHKGYAIWRNKKNGQCKDVPMHRFIIEVPEGFVADHINRNPLDNTRANLRIATKSQNQANKPPKASKAKTKFKGVHFDDNRVLSKWLALIKMNNKTIYIGSYTSEIEAALAYDKKALELYGEFAWLNSKHFPDLSNLA